MLINNLLYVGQSNAGPFKFVGAMETLEDPKQFIGIFHIESNAIIANKENILSVYVRRASYGYFSLLARTRILQGI
jgi:hypothetical protein